MEMFKKLTNILFFMVLAMVSCNKKPETRNFLSKENMKIEQQFVKNDTFPIGDVRRYGVFPNKEIPIDPSTNENLVQTVLNISEKLGIEVFFPKGYYNTSLVFDSRNNITIKFDNSEFSDVIHITNEGGVKSYNINLKGTLITYDRFGTYESNNVKIDSLIIKSESKKHKRGLKSRGCHIYTNTNNLYIKYLQVDDLSSDDINNHAALAIDGIPYPKNININKAIINASERHGAYIMGFDHKIDTLVIKDYALGNSNNMSMMQGAKEGEEKLFTGVWFNECYNTTIDYLEINSTSPFENKIDVNFDIGDKNYPVTIKELKYKFKIKTNRFSGEHLSKTSIIQ